MFPRSNLLVANNGGLGGRGLVDIVFAVVLGA